MGLDMDWIAVKSSFDRLKELVQGIQHGERAEIADDICDFEQKMQEKYGEQSSGAYILVPDGHGRWEWKKKNC